MSAERLYLNQLELGPMQNYVYLIGDPVTREAAIVDPGWEVPKILEVLARDHYTPTKVFITHTHFDHVMGLRDLLASVPLPVFVHETEAALLELAPGTTRPMQGGEVVKVGEVPVLLIHTPGHTPGSQCLLVGAEGETPRYLLTGDTLFIRGCGRCDLPGGDPVQLYESLTTRLKPLDDATVVCPGHNYAPMPTVSLGEEKKENPCMNASTVEHFLKMIGLGGSA